MKAYIHYSGGQPLNEECAVAWKGFEELGVACVPFSTNEELDTASQEDVVVAGVLVTGHALSRWEVEPPGTDYPEELGWLLGRKVCACKIGEVQEFDLPLFVKPVRDKELPALVARSMEDFVTYEAWAAIIPSCAARSSSSNPSGEFSSAMVRLPA